MQTIVGMFESRDAAEDAILHLQKSGYTNDQIGVAMRDHRESAEIAEGTGAGDLSAEGATAGAISGAGVGALIGLALAGSAIALPGLGPVLIAGPLAAGLTGAGVGAASGGLVGGLVGAGIPEEEAKEYHERIERGHILISVRCDDSAAPEARRILVSEGGENV